MEIDPPNYRKEPRLGIGKVKKKKKDLFDNPTMEEYLNFVKNGLIYDSFLSPQYNWDRKDVANNKKKFEEKQKGNG